MKRILVPIEQTSSMVSTLETAVQFAQKYQSYIEGFSLRPALAEYVAFEAGAGVFAETLAEQNVAAEKENRKLFENFMQSRGIAAHANVSPAYGWFDDAPQGDAFLGSRGRVFDVTVVGRPGADASSPRMGTFELALFESGHPVLIAPPSPRPKIATNVLIAWNGSAEQSRVTTLAIPVLRKASHVTVLTVEGGTAVPGPTGDDFCRYLQTHGIPATSQTTSLNGRNTGEAILASAGALGCDFLIKGAYTQSRLKQMIFGGATRHIVFHATMPILMAH